MKKLIYLVEACILGFGCWFLFSYNFNEGCFVFKKADNNQIELVEEDQPVKRRKFISNKLWRDDAAAKLEIEESAIVHVTTLDDEEYKQQLALKLVEEAAEVGTTYADQHELINEIGDVYEVLDCLIAAHNLSRDEILAAQEKKRVERGSYGKRQFVTYAEYLPKSRMVTYCLRQPDKYKEIVD